MGTVFLSRTIFARLKIVGAPCRDSFAATPPFPIKALRREAAAARVGAHLRTDRRYSRDDVPVATRFALFRERGKSRGRFYQAPTWRAFLSLSILRFLPPRGTLSLRRPARGIHYRPNSNLSHAPTAISLES